MKAFLALAVLTTSAVSFAADRAIYDIMYLPTAGTNYGATDLGLISQKVKGEGSNSDIDVSGFGLTQEIGRSISDQLLISGEIAYINTEADPDEGSKFDISGLTDLGVNARFRAVESDFIFDVIGGLTLSFADREFESDGDQNVQSGGHGINVGAQFGKKLSNLQWAVKGLLTHNFEADLEAGNDDFNLDPNNELLLQADLLNKLAEKSYLRSFVSVEFEEGRDIESPSQNFDEAFTTYSIGTEYQHLISAALLGRVGIDYSNYQHDSGDVESDCAFTLHAGATYQF